MKIIIPARLLLLTTALLMIGKSYGQSTLTPDDIDFKKSIDILPPSPNAAAIVKAGLFNLNKNTGAPDINIPIYGLKGRQLGMNIGIRYATNGIKVDEIASRVGMGWAMNAGGVITRIVRGSPDENVPRQHPWAQVGRNWSTVNYMNLVASSSNNTGVDAQPDLFNFSFNGRAGTFVFDSSMNVV